jgi:hypothetical protein
VSDSWVRPDFQKFSQIVVSADPVEKELASLRSGPVVEAATKTSRCCTVLNMLHQLQFIFIAQMWVSFLLLIISSFSVVVKLKNLFI